jgi:hypothetical protein
MDPFELLSNASRVRNHRISEWHAMFAEAPVAEREVFEIDPVRGDFSIPIGVVVERLGLEAPALRPS